MFICWEFHWDFNGKRIIISLLVFLYKTLIFLFSISPTDYSAAMVDFAAETTASAVMPSILSAGIS